MLAWIDEEAEQLTRETGEAWFWSRSRQRLWQKGETSGDTLAVVELRDDCDGDALLLRVTPAGPRVTPGQRLVLRARSSGARSRNARVTRPEGSYTAELLEAGLGACARKVGEEAVELASPRSTRATSACVEEAADLVYHLYVLLAARGLDVAQLEDELAVVVRIS